jgi:hypothetical protein
MPRLHHLHPTLSCFVTPALPCILCMLPCQSVVMTRVRVLSAADLTNHNPNHPPLSTCSREDHEGQGQRQVQGPLQPLPVHAHCHRCGQGQQAQAVPPPRFVSLAPMLKLALSLARAPLNAPLSSPSRTSLSTGIKIVDL